MRFVKQRYNQSLFCNIILPGIFQSLQTCWLERQLLLDASGTIEKPGVRDIQLLYLYLDLCEVMKIRQ